MKINNDMKNAVTQFIDAVMKTARDQAVQQVLDAVGGDATEKVARGRKPRKAMKAKMLKAEKAPKSPKAGKPAKKKRGRPAKIRPEAITTTQESTPTGVGSVTNATTPPADAPKKRGRKKKSEVAETTNGKSALPLAIA